MDNATDETLSRTLPLAHGLLYVVTGIWPLVSMDTFTRVTGPKTDLWLVKTVGLLIAVVGGVLTLAGIRRQPGPEVMALGAGSAAALATVDVVYVQRGRISRIYLLDAALEASLVAAWLRVYARAQSGRPQ